MGKPKVESPWCMAARLKGLASDPGGVISRVTPATIHFADIRLPPSAPVELQAAVALARVLRDEVMQCSRGNRGARGPVGQAEQDVADRLAIGVSTLRKTVQGARWPLFSEFARIWHALPAARRCLPGGDSSR